MARKALKLGSSILCEHVVRGEGNKPTLINVYSGDVIVNEFPANLTFGLYVELLPTDESMGDLTLTVELDKKTLGLVEAKGINQSSTGGVLVVPSFNIMAEKDATLEVSASAEGYRTSTILSKRILLHQALPSSTANTANIPPKSD